MVADSAGPVDAALYSRHSDAVGIVRLNRPERLNAVVPALVGGILAGFDQAEADGVRVLVITGNGRAFCAGYDLKEPEPDDGDSAARARLERLQDVTRRTIAFPGPVIAAVHGYALGAGAEFAFGCDLVVASSDAVFGFPEVEVGLSVTGGISHLLPRIVGLQRAKELILLGERFDAARAHDLGLVAQVTPVGLALAAALELAEHLATRPPAALLLAKRLLDAGVDATVDQALGAEVAAAMTTLHSGENADATARFRDR